MASRRRIRAVVFDFGGVLITPLTNQVGDLAGRHDTSLEEMLGVVIGPRDSGKHPWHCAERGELGVAEIQDLLAPWADEIGLTLHGDEVDVVLAPGSYTIVTPMVQRLARLRGEGIRTALLTNTFREFRPTLETIIDLSLFDCIIESYTVGARKPEPAIYEATAVALGVEHREIAYLDDFDQNLAPAEALGWTAIHVTDPVLAIAELDRVARPNVNRPVNEPKSSARSQPTRERGQAPPTVAPATTPPGRTVLAARHRRPLRSAARRSRGRHRRTRRCIVRRDE